MAEEGSLCELEGLAKQLESLLSCYSSDALRSGSELFCSDFCKLVEEYASRWQVPLPQLRILEIALSYFTRASTSFTSDCDHVLHTLSTLALSVFELLLFFDQKEFHEEPLKHFSVTFQECCSALARHQNVYLLQVERSIRGGGPWASLILQSILSDSNLPQNEVDGCISSELPVFFELRVRYLLCCERVNEAMALAKCCAQHPTAGQYLFFLQVYLTWLYKTSQHDRLHKEVADLNGKDAVHIICSLESEEKDDLLLALSRAFLSQQLRRGDMYYLCDLVVIWSKLHSQLNTSKQALLEESQQLLLFATNVNSIFPFIRVILQELGEDGIQFCVELCASALESCLTCDVVTKSLIYKTIAGMLPSDLEICRACALLVFFLERTVEAYKMVYLLYMHPDQEYHVEDIPIGNHVRFETLQILKKDLYFDPEFWNLIALRTNCLKLMSEKVVSAVLEEIMEDKWIPNYCTKKPALRSSASVCQKGSKGELQAVSKKRHHKEDREKEDADTASKRLKVSPGKTRLNSDHAPKKKGNQGSRPLKEASSKPLRRSFWQLDRIQDNITMAYGENRRTTRLSEKNPPKRRIRRPKWLLEDSGTLEENNLPLKIRKHGLKHQKHHRSSVVKRPETGPIKNNSKPKPSVNSHLKPRENDHKHQRELSLDCLNPSTPPQVILELSLPDNELMGTFTEDTCNRQRGFPQVLLYKPTVKLPATSQPMKTVHRKEVILRARDMTMFVLQLHCYARRQKGKGVASNMQGSVSTITRSSVQGSPPQELPREQVMKGRIASLTSIAPEVTEPTVSEKVLQPQTTKAASQKTCLERELSEKSAAEVKATMMSQTEVLLYKAPQAQTSATAREHCKDPAVEVKVTIASETPKGAPKERQCPGLVSNPPVSPEFSQTSTADSNQVEVADEFPPVSNPAISANKGAADSMQSQSKDVHRKQEQRSFSSQAERGKHHISQAKTVSPAVLSTVNRIVDNDASPGGNGVTLSGISETQATFTPTDQDCKNNISSLTLVTEMVAELTPETLAQDTENNKQAPENSASKEPIVGRTHKVPHRTRTTSLWFVSKQEASAVDDVQGKKGKEVTQDIAAETLDDESIETAPESEESKLEYCCTFCNKVFKGSRVVAHAMFHYRKDECTFCGTTFKDDLLAMMHLSDHIEKLKKSKMSAGNNAQENAVSDTEEIATPKTSAKVQSTNVSSSRTTGRPKKSAVFPQLESLPGPGLFESRKLRSDDKPVDEDKKQNTFKHFNSETPIHKVNGHIGKKKELDRMKKDLEAKQPPLQQEISLERTSTGSENPENQDIEMDSSASSAHKKAFGYSFEDKMETESRQVLRTASQQSGKDAEKQEQVCCPVDGCAWFTDLSKNRVALLYHALENHYGEVKPLELAFRVGNSKCSICMRVLWSFEHFLHHVERHRLTPRHPCLHQGCTARFKTGMEMRRHARRHSPLQAVCCLPGCSELFICLWALNLHEREHYASKPTKPDKNTNIRRDDNMQTGDKQEDPKTKDAASTAAVNRTTVRVKAARKLRGQATLNSSSRKHVKSAALFTVRASLLKERNGTKESNVLKNLSNKDTSTQRVPNLRLRPTLRKVTNANLAAPKTLKVISSSLLKYNSKVRHKFERKQVKINTKGPKRRGRPPKSKEAVYDENTTSGQNNETVLQKDQKSPTHLANCPKLAETSKLSDELKEETSKQVPETSVSESKSNNAHQNGVSQNTSTSLVTTSSLNHLATTTSADTAQKLSPDRMKKLFKAKKASAPKENSSQSASSDSSKSKKHTVSSSKPKTKAVKKNCALKELQPVSKKLAKSKSVVPHVDTKAAAAVDSFVAAEEKTKAENTDSTQKHPRMPAVTANNLNESAAPPTTSGETMLKKAHIRKKEVKKEKNTQMASSDKKKHREGNKNVDKSTAKGKQGNISQSKLEVQQVKSTFDDVGQEQKEASDATSDSITPSLSAYTLYEKTTEKKSKKSNTNGANKCKDIRKESDKKKKCTDQNSPSTSQMLVKSKTEVQPLPEFKTEAGENSFGKEGISSGGVLQPTVSSPGYSVITNGQATSEDVKSGVCKDTLDKYSKRPYVRLPPTAYLDEKYITMPKRRKEMSLFQVCQRSSPPEKSGVTAAVQRQRCANCFATFSSAEELQGHLQLQKCANLFGFDSEDEGNS
ncbi:uncharacterized protein LOC113127198 [Mastacembelus armatus]|uniref:Uncharacterized LOC113127198 n=1 Tax=Mastacembelus armatus TaxID=205130 RepID=A0A3Q3NIM1_9TELE|nr:uncharacterized protein LOC113127198 [Mastacembelus armatus]